MNSQELSVQYPDKREQERPSGEYVRLDLMTDDRIIVYGRVIQAMRNSEPKSDDIVDVIATGRQMADDLDEAIDDFALRHPERIRELFTNKLFNTQPQRERSPPLDASYMRPDLMSDDKIIVYARGLMTMFDQEPVPGDSVDAYSLSEDMMNDFARNVGQLGEHQPERLQGPMTLH